MIKTKIQIKKVKQYEQMYTNIPQEVKNALGFSKGDTLPWEIYEDYAIVRKEK